MTYLSMLQRPRRNRKSSVVRGFARETHLTPDAFIYPLFVHDGRGVEPIGSMPGAARHDETSLLAEVEGALSEGVRAFVLFPAVEEGLKTKHGEESYNPEGLVQRRIRAIKRRFPEATIVTDVALDPYNIDGHDGIVTEDGRILNDDTVAVLVKQAVSQADAGADIIAPSDMMDGRVAAIRRGLDEAGYTEVSILSYTAKYASKYYGPFRDALDSAPKSGDKKTYQMDPANAVEALREAELDEAEGADMLMVKPAGPYLDIISALASASTLPIAAYQVSGEYAMIKAAGARGWVEERSVVLESLLGIRRAGAKAILTYFARDAARYLREGG
ncbi:MAG: porphobilinogen synthase [Myxococcales bacterium]|nr:porphobilinogen synthase [Myxococcales bacterium]